MLRVAIYCPDRHVRYDESTPGRSGVGGGVTARMLLARALADRGCHVTVVANVNRRRVQGRLEMQPLDGTRRLDADMVIFNSTGGALDLAPAADLEVRAKLRIVWIGGTARVGGLDSFEWDVLVSPSNFVRRSVHETWASAAPRRAVIHNGAAGTLPWPLAVRHRRRLVYAGHPAKGLDATFTLVEMLRARDARFELHVFGGRSLWGQPEDVPDIPPGVVWHGLVGQRALRRSLRRASFGLHLQGMPDGFGLSLVEAMRAGCIVIASRLGAYPELVRHGYDGFLLDGPHDAPDTLRAASALILRLVDEPVLTGWLRRNAVAAPLRWSEVAQAWIEFLGWALDRKPVSIAAAAACPECGGKPFVLADGHHCPDCGCFARDLVSWTG